MAASSRLRGTSFSIADSRSWSTAVWPCTRVIGESGDGDAPSSGIEHTKATFVIGLVFPTRADSCSERLPLLAESWWGLNDFWLRGWLGATYHARGLYLLSTIELTNTGAILVVAPGRLGGWAAGGFVRSVSHLRVTDGARRPTRAKGR